MAIVRCPVGHYYNDAQISSCQYHEKYENVGIDAGELNEQLASYYDYGNGGDDYSITEAYVEGVEEYERTIGNNRRLSVCERSLRGFPILRSLS